MQRASYIEKQVRLLAPYLTHTQTLLDFGCGDLTLARGIHEKFPKIHVTGIDVVDGGGRTSGIDFRLYDGKQVPFKDRFFDTSVAYHVFHHTEDPRMALYDLMRVTKRTILMVEPVYRNRVDLFFMKILDRYGNGWRGVHIPMPFTFQHESTWRRFAREFGWSVLEAKPAGVLPGWLPFGETKLFVLQRK